MPFSSPGNNLQTIMQKVRRLTRTPSQAQLDDNTLVDYINTFILYDFPEHLRTFNFRVQFTFVCNPFQDLYYTDIAGYGGASNAQANQLYDFQNNYLTIHPPVYIAGFQSFYTQSREQFFGIYPIVNNIQFAGVGDSAQTNFTGVINIINQGIINNVVQGTSQGGAVLLKNQVLFDSIDVNGNGLSMIDSPILDSVTGNPTIWGILYPANNPPATTTILCAPPYNDITVNPQFTPFQANFINYLTGQFSVTFPIAPLAGAPVNSQTVPLVASMPQALLFYQNRMIVRPIPDQPYRINFEAYQRPSALLETNSIPALQEYWQYLAYGAAKKIFEDRMDLESVQMIMPEFKKQENLVQRRTIVQYTNERTATIYTEQTGVGGSYNSFGNGGGSF